METIVQPRPTKARKVHRCDFCELKIEQGETYERSVHKMDGSVYEWKSHLDCSWIASELNMFDHCDEGLTGEAFQEEIMIEFEKLEFENPTERLFSKFLSQVIEYHKEKCDRELGVIV
ncbi:MAG: hypothetical protein SH817_08455 [Leptospira sp.]|nr:hypothetical protein [Leptospira sp.]